MKQKIRKAVKYFDIPDEIQTGFYIEIYSDKEMVLTGKTDVLELGESVLKLQYSEHRIEISGEKLQIVAYNSDGIRISGKILNMGFY